VDRGEIVRDDTARFPLGSHGWACRVAPHELNPLVRFVRVLLRNTDDVSRRILADASRYASDTLAEVEARSHYIHALRGQP
jgi:hypothetical protein